MKTYFNYWGKARRADEVGPPCHLLPYHCLDVAAIGEVLLTQHPHMMKHLETMFRLEVGILRPWIIFLLALHDLGKFAESFQQLQAELRQAWWNDITKSSYDIRHDSLGYLLWEDQKALPKFLKDEGGLGLKPEDPDFAKFCRKILKVWLQPVTGHHGLPPKIRKGSANARAKTYFQPFDMENAKRFVDEVFALFSPDTDVLLPLAVDKAWCKMQKEASWVLAGFAVLCDWLGSDADVFEYCDDEMLLDEYWRNYALPRALRAVKKAGVLPAEPAPLKPLKQVFPYISQPTPLQSKCAKMDVSNGPELFILEDVTGSGKTEAAMMLAHRLMAQGQANGLYIALPTMATANAMYERMAEVYRALYAENHRPSLILAHSASHLSELFQTALFSNYEADSTYAEWEDTASVQCSRWLADHRKAALLAEVGIGTLDQALLGILPARHQSLRLLGLANKVLIVDEVHAYDAYMNKLLKTLLYFHARFGGCAILLSATLPYQTRQDLVEAFRRGLDGEHVELSSTDYPLLTSSSAYRLNELELDTRDEVKRKVDVELIFDEETVFALIRRAVEKGKCVCWVRNTVFDAREAYAQLLDFPWVDRGKLSLFHSRFTLADRLELEKRVQKRFGKDSAPDDRLGQILVATQVVEQSLDLDFDIMISDLAPMDLLIQRAGRLCRHVRDRTGQRLHERDSKDQRGIPMFYVFSPKPEISPDTDWFKSVFPKANSVYPHTGQLWRTARLLAGKQGWRMPDDARELMEGVYGELGETIPEALIEASNEAEGEHWAQAGMADFNALILEQGYTYSDGKWDEEARIPTRLSDDSQAVYLAVWENDLLRPYSTEGRYCWDLSSVNINAERIRAVPDSLPDAIEQAVNQLKEDEKGLNKFSLLLPLIPKTEKTWTGQAIDGRGNTIDVLYSRTSGLLLAEEITKFGEPDS